MVKHKHEIARRQITSVTNLAIAVNAALCCLKLVVGFFGGSVALVADGVHSLSDMSTDVVVLLGVRLGSKEPDAAHPYGHGRVETFSGAVIALLLLCVGAGMIYYAGLGIARGQVIKPRAVVVAVALVSIIVKELLCRLTRRVAIKSHSPALYANAWHQRSDALSSVAVVLGVVSLRFGYEYGDHIAAIAVGLMIVLVAIQIIRECLGELTERAVDPDTIKQMEEVIGANPSIHQWHKLRTRTVGREVFVDLHILVDSGLNVAAAHEIAEGLENAMHDQIARPVNITVHIEPDIPELRK